ncbi:MAG TPA: ATP-binding protein [Thermoanaerobaculia bacterium]|nr:ATP-binding protein [Thermoanaerobaculia bacterium]
MVVFCWLQVCLAGASLALAFYNNVTRPTLQFNYSRTTGQVEVVVPGGTADKAGLKVGDRIVSIQDQRIGYGLNPMLFTRSGDLVPVQRAVRDGIGRKGAPTTEVLSIRTVPYEDSLRASLGLGAGPALSAIVAYLFFPLNAWMFALGVALLLLRPNDGDGRLASLAFVYLAAGGNFIANQPGIGAQLSTVPEFLRGCIYLTDCFFAAMFFAVVVNFAMVFANVERRVSRRWQALSYVISVPIFIEAALWSLTRTRESLAQAQGVDVVYRILGPAMLALAVVILSVRSRRVHDANAQRRLKLTFLALLSGSLGLIAANILVLFDRPTVTEAGEIIERLGEITGAAIFAYAVVRHRMFNIRVLVRRSIQYVLARGTLLVLMSLPVIGLASYLYAHRSDSIAVALTGAPVVLVLIMVPLGLVVRYRKRVLEALDRRYFREQYDSRRLLLQVVSMVRDGLDIPGLSRVALDEIEQALHPRHISIWHSDPENRQYELHFVQGAAAPPNVAALRASGALPALLSKNDEPLDLYSRHTRQLVAKLPAAEQEWLRVHDAYLLVPMLIGQRLAGMMVLGERKSEEPYGKEDRQLLKTVATQLALTFDYSRLKESPSPVMERLRTRIAADLHDDVGSGLSRIALLSELGRRRTIADPAQVDDLFAQIGDSSRELIDATGDIVWAIDPRHEHLGSLLARLRRFAADLLEDQGVRLAFAAPSGSTAIFFGPGQRRDLYLLLKEAIHNIAKHANAQTASVRLTVAEHELTAEVCDDGMGFIPDTAGHGEQRQGQGLRSMYERASRLGGTLQVESTIGAGTRLHLRVPL